MLKSVLIHLVLFTILFHSSINSQTVYITKTGKKYHTQDCSYLRNSSYNIELKDAIEKGYSPCSRCKPQVISNSNNSATTTTVTQKKSTSKEVNISKRCAAITKKGTQCKRTAQKGSNYCWQHNR